MKATPSGSFWGKYKIFIGAGVVAIFLLAFASFVSNEIARMENAKEAAWNSSKKPTAADKEAVTKTLPKP